MNVTQPWNIVFLIGFFVFYGILSIYARRAKSEPTAVSQFGGREKFLLALMYLLRVAREERLMCESFGDEYRDYMRRTGRLFPRMK